MMMSTARRRRTKSLGVICLILASLTCSPPTAAVIRPAEGRADHDENESDENDVVAVGVGSLSPPPLEHEFEAEAFVHQRHTDSVRRQPQQGGSNDSLLSKIESLLDWRGILWTYHEDEDRIIDGQPQQRPEDYGLSPSLSAASWRSETNRHGSTTATARHLRSTKPAEIGQATQRRGSSSSRSRQATWCEFAYRLGLDGNLVSLSNTHPSPTRALSILIFVLSLSLINSRGLVHQSMCPILRSQHLQQSQLCRIGTLG